MDNLLKDNFDENSHAWKGEKAGYRAKHMWIISRRGSPNYCEHCKRNDKRMYNWANVDHKYKRIIGDYMRLCVSCHRKYDIKSGLVNIDNFKHSIRGKSTY